MPKHQAPRSWAKTKVTELPARARWALSGGGGGGLCHIIGIVHGLSASAMGHNESPYDVSDYYRDMDKGFQQKDAWLGLVVVLWLVIGGRQ
jgi:hypothetical protein